MGNVIVNKIYVLILIKILIHISTPFYCFILVKSKRGVEHASDIISI